MFLYNEKGILFEIYSTKIFDILPNNNANALIGNEINN